MTKDLYQDVRGRLAKMSPDELREMADNVEGVSFSLLSKLSRDKYESSITYKRLASCAEYLRKQKARTRSAA